jgi:ubiquinone/menaquinone biosynthesis C-methylase UbiE
MFVDPDGRGSPKYPQKVRFVDAILLGPAMIRQRAAVRRSSPLGVQFVEANAEDVPLADASFDLAKWLARWSGGG